MTPRTGCISSGAMSDFMSTGQVTETRQLLERLKVNMRLAIKGKDDVIERTLVCLAAGGHLLIEDLPGLGKTTLAYSLARSMDCTFAMGRSRSTSATNAAKARSKCGCGRGVPKLGREALMPL